MIQAIPLPEAIELLLQRADELKERKADPTQLVEPDNQPAPKRLYLPRGKCRGCRQQSDQRTVRLGLCPPCRRERFLQQLRTNNDRRRGKTITVEAIVAKPCCSQCGAEGRVSRNLKLCDECKHRRMARKVKAKRVLKVADWRASVEPMDSLPEPVAVTCPHCGRPMMPGAIGCWRHSTLLLLERMHATSELYNG